MIRNDSALNDKLSPLLAVEHTMGATGMPHMLYCGGFHSDMRGTKASHLAAYCASRGYGYTRFDYRGHGQSPESSRSDSIADWLDDTLSVLDSSVKLSQPGSSLKRLPLVVIGSSMGAWLAVLATLERGNDVAGLVLIAAAPDFTSELLWPALSTQEQSRIEAGETLLRANGYDASMWPLHRTLFDSGKQLSVLPNQRLANILCPVRLLHGTADTDVPWTQSQRLLVKLKSSDADLRLLHLANHRLSDTLSLAKIENAIEEVVRSIDTCDPSL